jgi:hypothetical protein
LNIARESGAEHESLAILGARHILSLDDSTNLGLETHVKHAIGLIENKVANIGETNTSTLDEIDETAGSGAEEVATTLNEAQLLIDIGATINYSGTDPRAIGEFACLVVNLGDKLASGSKN